MAISLNKTVRQSWDRAQPDLHDDLEKIEVVLNALDLSAGFPVLTADPLRPANNTWWVRRSGVSPALSVALRVRIDGATQTLAEITL